MSTKTRLITTVLAILIVTVLVIVGAVTKAQTSQTNAQVVILNLLNGQQYFGVPHVYQGDYNGKPTNQWPVYLGPSNASKYWLKGHINSDQPVLELVPYSAGWASGTMFWSETYSGGLVKITIIGTFSNGSSLVANGFIIYLFLKPTKWGISPNYNYTIPYAATTAAFLISPIQGDVIGPQSSTPYIMVQWDPIWQFAPMLTNDWNIVNGQWIVWIVNNTNGNHAFVGPSPSPSFGSGGYAGWDGAGGGDFQPEPGDWINVTVTYDPSTNTLSCVAVDLNHTGWGEASFTVYLGNDYTPPSSGTYVFGVGASGGSYVGVERGEPGYGSTFSGGAYANWALLYVAMTQRSASISTSISTTATATTTTTTTTTTTITTTTTTNNLATTTSSVSTSTSASTSAIT
ncbi:MAG: hypothetical protein RXQ94_08375, partial [Caldivirga sp.]